MTVPAFMSPTTFVAAATLGHSVFNGLVATAFLLCCGASLLTSDIISRERREGTLGLLLLTRVRSFDLLLGKLSSSGITSLCSLLAFLPVLVIPILAGGVTGGVVARKGLALLNSIKGPIYISEDPTDLRTLGAQ